MPDHRTPFDKISAGLDDAIAYSKGDTARGRRHDIPVNEADRQARSAFRRYAQWCDAQGRNPAIDMAPRTYSRIFAGSRDVPPGAAREMAALVREEMTLCRESERLQLEGWAMALEAWAQDCDQRKGRPTVEFKGDDTPMRGLAFPHGVPGLDGAEDA